MGILYFMVKMKYDALKLALFCRNSFKNILCLTQSRGIDSSEHFSGMKDIQIDKHKKKEISSSRMSLYEMACEENILTGSVLWK